jgi:protein phosphatase
MPSKTPSPPALVHAALTVVGRVRQHNEDALLCQPRLGLWAVADGMGGHRRGEVASALGLETLRKRIARGDDLLRAIHCANEAILSAAKKDDGSRGMGTTLVAVRFQGADFQLAWVGDSRAYRVGAGSIEQLSRDHSWVQAMVDAGRMSPEEAGRHPRRNVVTQCLGQEGLDLDVDSLEGTLGNGELLLLCSDGLTRELSDARIQEICARAGTLEDLVSELVDTANRMGGNDNISCIVLGLAPPSSEPMPERPRGFLDKLFKPAKS